MTGRRGRRRRKLLNFLKERRGYFHLKKQSLDRTLWRARFGRGFGPVVRQTTKEYMYIYVHIYIYIYIHKRARLCVCVYVCVSLQPSSCPYTIFPWYRFGLGQMSDNLPASRVPQNTPLINTLEQEKKTLIAWSEDF